MNVEVPHNGLPEPASLPLSSQEAEFLKPISKTMSAVDWDQFIDELLPDTPDSSKFTKMDFVAPSFVVDSFIEKRKDGPLDHLRQLLASYASRIRSASVAIINEDYADFIHLSSSLMGVGKSIDKVLRPLTDARDEVAEARNQLSIVIQTLEDKQNRLRQVRKLKSDIDKMVRLDQQLTGLESRLKQIQTQDPIANLISSERFKADLLEVERTLQSVYSKSKLLFSQKDRFSQLSFELERIRLK